MAALQKQLATYLRSCFSEVTVAEYPMGGQHTHTHTHNTPYYTFLMIRGITYFIDVRRD